MQWRDRLNGLGGIGNGQQGNEKESEVATHLRFHRHNRRQGYPGEKGMEDISVCPALLRKGGYGHRFGTLFSLPLDCSRAPLPQGTS